MLWRAQDLYGIKLRGVDGTVGHVRDLLFDDTTWAVSYLVGEEIAWPFPHTFVLAPFLVKSVDWRERTCVVAISRDQVNDRARLHLAGSLASLPTMPGSDPYRWPSVIGVGAASQAQYAAEPGSSLTLKSARTLGGFAVQTKDGRPGSVIDLMIHNERWAISDLLVYVQTPGLHRRMMVSPQQIERIDWVQGRIDFDHLPAAPEPRLQSTLPASILAGHAPKTL